MTDLIPNSEHQRIDALEQRMLSAAPVVYLPLIHRFTPGLYIREIFMPAGTLLTSKIHRQEHPYVVLSGRVSVWIPGVGVQTFTGGHVGITKPGTRRVLYIHEDTRWITFHPSGETDLEKIEAELIEPRELEDGTRLADVYQQLLRAASPSALEPQVDYGGAP